MNNFILRTSSTVSEAPGPQYDPHAARAFSSMQLVPVRVADQARQNPDRFALIDEGVQLNYGELDRRAESLAARLQSSGVGANIVVAVCMRRSSLAVLAALAVLKAGGAYLPLDQNYPSERISFILNDAKVRILLSDGASAGRLPEGSWQLLVLDLDAAHRETNANDRPVARICPDHLSYVIYTSGSTGTPKGVEVTHGNLANLVSWHQKAFAVTAEDRATQFASFGFDAAVWELWPHLTTGAAVFIIPDQIRSSPALLRDWLIASGITISFVPTAIAERLIALDWPAKAKLRILLTGADTLHHYPRAGLPFELINNYGPTESTVVATSGRVPPQPNAERRPSIGRPIDNTQVHILDEFLRTVAQGDTGELCIAGAGVANGYVNSPELTARKFVLDPFSKKKGARLYRTGDLARWLPNGEIEYIGRVDNLIKVRGYRVEPNEIVGVLDTHNSVEASAVIARPDGTGNMKLVAYIVTKKAQPRPSASELRDLLRSRLPDYMVPSMFVEVPELPLNTNGKLDRDALPAPEGGKTLADDNYAPPSNFLEEQLTALVAELLGVDRVGMNDNFFLIGGHSLFGTQLIARIRDTFAVDLPLRSVFESPTPAQLARQITALMVNKINAMSPDEVQHALEQANLCGGQQ